MKLLLYVLGDDHWLALGVLTLDGLSLHDGQVDVARHPGKCEVEPRGILDALTFLALSRKEALALGFRVWDLNPVSVSFVTTCQADCLLGCSDPTAALVWPLNPKP